jgi:flagellar protein FliO/FliZ
VITAIKKFSSQMNCKFFPLVMLILCDPVSAELVNKTASEVSQSPDVTSSLLKVTGGLLLVILAILGSAWAYRRFGNMTPIANDALRVIGGVSMGAKERVVLMQVGEEQILLGVSPGRIQRLHVLEKNIDVGSEKTPENKSFSTQLNSALKQWKS